MRGRAETKRIVIAAIAVLVAGGLAYAGHGLYQKRALRAQIAARLPQAQLPDEAAIKDARARALAAAEATRLEFEQTKRLVPR